MKRLRRIRSCFGGNLTLWILRLHRSGGVDVPSARRTRTVVPSPLEPTASSNGSLEAFPRSGLDDAMLMSGDERFYRLHNAFHDDATENVSPGTLAAGSAYCGWTS